MPLHSLAACTVLDACALPMSAKAALQLLQLRLLLHQVQRVQHSCFLPSDQGDSAAGRRACAEQPAAASQVCSKCRGRLQFIGKFNRDGQVQQERSLSEYSAFMKRTFSEVKGTLPPGTPNSEVFSAVSARWRQAKAQGAHAAGEAAREVQLGSPLTPSRKQLFL